VGGGGGGSGCRRAGWREVMVPYRMSESKFQIAAVNISRQIEKFHRSLAEVGSGTDRQWYCIYYLLNSKYSIYFSRLVEKLAFL